MKYDILLYSFLSFWFYEKAILPYIFINLKFKAIQLSIAIENIFTICCNFKLLNKVQYKI